MLISYFTTMTTSLSFSVFILRVVFGPLSYFWVVVYIHWTRFVKEHTYTIEYFIVRIDFLSSLQGEQTVRTLPKTNQILQRLLKSMPKPSRRYVHESIPTKTIVKSHLVLDLVRIINKS